MSWLGFWRKKSWSSDEVRDALLGALKQGDDQEFARLCGKHRPIILESFAHWQTMPDLVRRDQNLAELYPALLERVANWFADQGDAALKALLLFQTDEDPAITWERLLQQAQTHLDQGQPAQAMSLLQPLEQRLAREEGTHVDHYRPRVRSLMGTVHFRQGRQAEAIAAMRQAIAHCNAIGDEAGAARYTESLNLMQRDERWR